jgi:TonB family protein
MPLFCTIGLLCSFFSSPLHAADAKQLLETHFQNKVFGIRGFYRDNHLVYDAQGNVKGHPQVGPWTLALIDIDRVEAGSNEFRIEGKRVISVYDGDKKQFVNRIAENAALIKIAVEVPANQLSDTALDTISDRIFQRKVTANDVPDYWRNVFSPDPSLAQDYAPGNVVPGLEWAGKPVFKVRGAITPPQLLTKKEPKYEEIARLARVQGYTVLKLIVDTQGAPERIQVSQPLGVGLDDSAVAAVSNWRFKPATMNGQAVPVLVSVEVAFRFH